MKPKKQKISITLDPTLIDQLQLHAEDEERSLSSQISFIVRQWLNDHQERTLILERQHKV